MGMLKTALQLAMRAGKPLRSAADIVKEGRALWTAGRGARAGRTAGSIADDMVGNATMRPNMMRSGGGGMMPSSNSMVQSGGGGMMPYNAGGKAVPTGGSAMVRSGGAMTPYNPGGAMVRSGGGAMTPYNPGGLPARRSGRFIPPIGLVPMFTNPPLTPPTVGPNDWDDVPDPTLTPRDPLTPSMTPGWTPAVPDVLPPPMIPRSPVPMTMPPPQTPMAIPPNMELPDAMPSAPHIPTMPDMSMGVPDITMPGFEVAFDDLNPTPGLMNVAEPEIDYGFLEGIEPLPTPRKYLHGAAPRLYTGPGGLY